MGVREQVSDQDLQKVRMEVLTPHDGPITLVDYDPNWPALFQCEAARIRELLGEGVLRLEHAGSTSVPGLAAKPIIDIVLVVPDSADEAAYVPTLTAAGYRLLIREPDWFEHRLLKGPDIDINLLVFTTGSDAPVPRSAADLPRGPRAIRTNQAIAGATAMAPRPALGPGQVRGSAGHPRPFR